MKTDVAALREAGYFSPLEYRFAESLSRIVPEASPHVLLGAALAMKLTQEGHVCAEISGFAGKPVQSPEGSRFSDHKWPSPKRWIKEIASSPLTSVGNQRRPLVLDDSGRLYLYRYWRYQEQLTRWLFDRASASGEAVDEETLSGGLDRLFGPISSLDGAGKAGRAAAERACRKKLSIVTGGPGTGKTTLVMRILALLAEQMLRRQHAAPRIVAAAPTGKAARRLGEVMSEMAPTISDNPNIVELLPTDAVTIHRLLGAKQEMRDAAPLIAADVVVVDEASMVDIALMHDLVMRMRPSARLLLLGDRDQLSSVESGAVLADICDVAAQGDSPIASVTSKLTHSFRFDGEGGIGRLAGAINDGDSAEVMRVLTSDPSRQVTYRSVRSIDDIKKALYPLILHYFGETLSADDPETALKRFSAFRILTAHRRGAAGKEGLNRFVEMSLQRQGLLRIRGAWYVGRPVMVMRNDYHSGLYNGDVGLALPSSDNPSTLSIYFSGETELREQPPARLGAAETAFAMTVHRSQGSEFDHVAIVLPEKPSPIVVRELLYTACTRARKKLTVIGAESVIRHAVTTPTVRSSGLKDRLSALAGEIGRSMSEGEPPVCHS